MYHVLFSFPNPTCWNKLDHIFGLVTQGLEVDNEEKACTQTTMPFDLLSSRVGG